MSKGFKLIVAASIIFCTLSHLSAQDLFRSTKSAERRWAVAHPFIVNGCIRETKKAMAYVKITRGRFGLDSSYSEGTFDAFRHAFWMATLAQKYDISKVLKLGAAHEKSNYISFRRNEKQHGIIPDLPNSEMDTWNNKKGAEIGKKNRNAGPDSLRIIILDEMRRGSFRVISKDRHGHYLDCNGAVIPPEKVKGTWENPKCLSPSKLD